MSDKKEYGDGLKALTTNELLNVLITELDQLRMFWRKFFNVHKLAILTKMISIQI